MNDCSHRVWMGCSPPSKARPAICTTPSASRSPRFARLPREGARCFADALQLFRILHFSIWAEGEYHVIVGRLDQYLYPYLAADLAAGTLTEEGALELVEEFFISFKKRHAQPLPSGYAGSLL